MNAYIAYLLLTTIRLLYCAQLAQAVPSLSVVGWGCSDSFFGGGRGGGVAKCTVPQFFHLSRLTQKADNVPDFSQTLSLGARRWHLLSQQKLISLVEATKVALGTVFINTEPFGSIDFRRGIIAHHAPRRRKGVWLTIFALAKRKFISCPGCLIWKRHLAVYYCQNNNPFFVINLVTQILCLIHVMVL